MDLVAGVLRWLGEALANAPLPDENGGFEMYRPIERGHVEDDPPRHVNDRTEHLAG